MQMIHNLKGCFNLLCHLFMFFNFKEFESQDNLSYFRGDSGFDVKRFIYKKIIKIYH